MSRVLVTGAAGFVGAALVARLAAHDEGEGLEIFATCRTVSAQLNEIARRRPIQVIDGVDLSEPDHVARLPGDLTHVVHAAALARFEGQPVAALRAANVEATAHLLAHLKRTSAASLKRLIFVSTFGVHDRPLLSRASAPIHETSPFAPASEYGRTKLQAERLVRLSGLPHAVVRLSWIYGPEMRADSHIRVLARMCANGSPVTKIDFPGRVSVAAVDDTADAITRLLFKDKLQYTAYLIAHDEPISFGQMFRTFHTMLGRSWRPLPAFGALTAGSLAAPLLPMKVRSLLEDYYVCSPRRLAEEGITLPTPFASGIHDSVTTGRWFSAS